MSENRYNNPKSIRRAFMKRMGAVLTGLMFLFAASLGAQDVTSIYDIQYTEDSSGDSPLKGETVTVQGIVTGETYAYGDHFFVQDSAGAWSGVMVFVGNLEGDEGMVGERDMVTVTGTVEEYYGMTQISASSVTIDSMWHDSMEPITVNSGDIATGGSMAEAFEGVLVKVENAEIAEADLGYGEWSIDDGSGAVRVDDNADYYFWPGDYDSVEYVVGPLNYSFDDTKIEPRLAADVVPVSEYTRIQRLQQVRGSDLARIGEVANDDTLDYTYYLNYDADAEGPLPGAETFTIKGIVTMPTGLSYAGDGVKFIMADEHGGPWSGLLLYSPDSTAFPVLYEGDKVEVEGYVGEYNTGPSNMTEFWVSGEVNILSVGNETPEEPHVNTGDLRWPITAEQWGTVFVKLKDVIVTVNDYAFNEWGVSDGSGEVRIDDDSDSLANFIRPPVGTGIDSISGWVYHHFGSYEDSSTYKVEPLYEDDIVIGEGPPSIRNYTRTPGVPGPSDQVTVTAELSDNSEVTAGEIFYRVNGGSYQTAEMSLVEGITWSGSIPAQAEGDWVDFFVKATDDNDTYTTLPSDTSTLQYSYRVTSDLTIYDLQYTPWPNAQTPYEGAQVTVTGVVTADTAFNSLFEAYPVQDPDATEWGGIFVWGVSENLQAGQEVTVTGEVTDYNPDWSFKYDNNTMILASNVEPGDQVGTPPAQTLTAAELDENAEVYESMLVRLNDVEVTSVNQYDWTVTDESGGEVLIDDDASYLGDWFSTLEVGTQIGDVRGIWTYSFGTYKIELRNESDHGQITGINEDRQAQPYTYSLDQNYPNPFNPSTNLRFSLADQGPVTVAIYDVRGQLVKTLVKDQTMDAGQHVLHWDGTNNSGVRVGSGIYIYRLKAGDFIKAKKMTLLR